MVEEIKWSLSSEPKPVFQFGTRNAFVTNEFAKMRSVTVAYNYADILRLGVSGNWLAKGFDKPHAIDLGDGTFKSIEKSLRMLYIAPSVEYTFYRSEHWELAIPFQLGAGLSYFVYEDGEKHRIDKDWIALYEPSMRVQYRFLKYFGIGGGIGYRLMIKNNKHLDEKFTSPLYTVGLKIFFSDVYKDFVKTD